MTVTEAFHLSLVPVPVRHALAPDQECGTQVGVAVGVKVGVLVAVAVGVLVDVTVGVGVGHALKVSTNTTVGVPTHELSAAFSVKRI